MPTEFLVLLSILLLLVLLLLASLVIVFRNILKCKLFTLQTIIFVLIISIICINVHKLDIVLDEALNGIHKDKRLYKSSELHNKLKFIVDLHSDSVNIKIFFLK